MMLVRSFVLAIVLLGLTACTTTPEPQPEPTTGNEPMQTESSSYILRTEDRRLRVEIPYTYENRTGGHVYLVNCNGAIRLRLERATHSGWRMAWSPFEQDCLSPPIVIDPGSTFDHTLVVDAGVYSSNVHPKFDIGNPSGIYRIVWTEALSSFDSHNRYSSQHPFGPPIPLEARISNPFRLKLET